MSADPQRIRHLAALALLFAVAALTFDAGRLLAAGYAAVRFPWELDYGEGIVWEQMRLMLAGRGYGSIDGLPAIVFHYPPLFHMVTAAISAATGLDPLAAGRSVSIGSTLLTGLFAGLIAAKTVGAEASVRTATLCGLVAGLAVFSFWPIAFWAPFMRVDMLATALGFAGLLAAMAAFKKPPLIFTAATCFVAAVYTKQTSIVTPAAVFLTFLLLRPRLAWLLASSCVAMGLVALGALALATDGGFVRHVFLYNVNRFEAWRLLWIRDMILAHFPYFLVLAIGISSGLAARLPRYKGIASLACLRQRLAGAPADSFFLLVLVHALLASLMTLSVAKSGSNLNYLIEWVVALSILLGIAIRNVAAMLSATGEGTAARPWIPLFLPLLIGVQALTVPPPPDYAAYRSPMRIAQLEKLSAMVRAAERPVVSDDMVLLVRSGVPVQWEPAIFAELASTNAWDESRFVERVRSGHFAFFITVGTRGQRRFDSRYNGAVADAMDATYPVKRDIAGYTLHLRRAP